MCILDLGFGDLALPFDLRLPEAGGRIIRKNVADVVKAALLAAGTGIKNEGFSQVNRARTSRVLPAYHPRARGYIVCARPVCRVRTA